MELESTRYLLDTNIISALMKNPKGAAAHQCHAVLHKQPAALLCTSVIVQCELLFGLQRLTHPRWQTHYQRIIESLEVLPLEENVALHYAQLRTELELNGNPMSPNDLLIAAHALALDATLVTADAAFTRVNGLRVENWNNQT